MAATKVTFTNKNAGDTVSSSDINQLKNSANGAIDDASSALSVANDAQTIANNAVVKISGKGLSSNDFTDQYKVKVDSLTNYFVGAFSSLSALQIAFPTGLPGQYANVDIQGANAVQYIWDNTDNAWVQGSSSSGSGGGSVTSVNGQSGAVILDKTSIGLGNVPNVDATQRANQTGTQSADTITDGLTNKVYSGTDKTKLSGIATGATANSPDATLLARANHTGTQPATTISGLAAVATSGNKSDVSLGNVDNTSDVNKPVSTAQQLAISAKLDKTADKASTVLAQAGADDSTYMTPAKTASAIISLSPVGALQPETTAYSARVVAANGNIDATTLFALDTFVSTGKADGWWPLVKFFAPMVGPNLNTMLTKFVVDASGLPTMVNNNFLATDYLPSKGIVLTTSNTSKYLSTGFIPTNNGISASSIGMGFLIPDDTQPTVPGYVVADNPTTGDSNVFVNNSTSAGFKNWYNALGGGVRVQSVNKSGVAANTVANGVLGYSATSGITATEDLTTEITIAKATRNGTVYYQKCSIGGLIFTSGLTLAQHKSMNKALYKMYKALGRIAPVGDISYWFGDSITFGQAASTPLKRFSTLISTALGQVELNVGEPSSQLRQSQPTTSPYTVGGFDRYTDTTEIDVNNVYIMYGTNDMNLNDANTNGTTASISDLTTKLITIYNFFIAKFASVMSLSISWGSTPSATKNLAYVNGVYAAAKSAGVPFVDCYNIMLDTNAPATFYADGLHPNDAGNALIAKHVIARKKGRPYRDLLIPATLVPANGTATITFTLYELLNSTLILLGSPTVATAGITYSVAYSADDTAVLTLKNTTGADITTAVANINVTYLLPV